METPSDAAQKPETARSGINAILAVLLALGAIAWSSDVLRMLGVILYTEQFLLAMIAVAIPLVLLSIPATKGGGRRWYDIAGAVLAFAAAIYMAERYPRVADLVAASPTDSLIAGIIVLVLLIEGLRRTVGMVLTCLVLAFAAMGLWGHLLPGQLAGREMEWRNLFYYLAWDTTGILGVPMKIVATIVMAFVFFGQVLTKTGGSAFFTEISMVLVGRFRGGQAKIAITASGFFGSISGSVVSNVVTTGVITIPLMRSGGYRSLHAGAIEAVASTGGQLMPPIMGAAAFLMAEFLEIPYTEVVVAALIPAILYYAALFILADLEAVRSGIRPLTKDQIPKAWPVLKTGWYFPIPFVVLIGTLFWLNWTPEESALVSAAVVIAIGMTVGYKGKRLSPGALVEAVRDTGFAVLDIIMIGAAAGIVIATLNVTGVGFGLSLALVELGEGNILVLLFVSAFICILLGMGMPTVGVYLLLATLVAPSLVEIGISPIAAHLFILYFGMMSMITPPVAIAAFAAASLTGEDPMRTGFAAMRFGWFAYLVPFLFIATPELLMIGSGFAILLTAVKSVAGIWLVSVGIMGYLYRNVDLVSRLLLVIAGLAMLIPSRVLDINLPLAMLGLVLGGAVVGRELLAGRHLKQA